MFLVFAVIVTGLLYHFRSLGDIQNAGAASVEGLKSLGQKVELSTSKSKSNSAENTKDQLSVPSLVDSGPAKTSAPASNDKPTDVRPSKAPATDEKPKDEKVSGTKKHPPPIDGGDRLATKASASTRKSNVAPSDHPYSSKSTSLNKTFTGSADPLSGNKLESGRLQIVEDTIIPKIHWSEQPEHFPVPTDSLIQLPSGKPKKIPRIQHDFASSNADGKLAQTDKLDTIKKAFTYSWAGYRERAWMQDELSPMSGKYRNGFCGWGATLVDSLDTLWMMDLKDEFEEAVDAVKDIDFTTSARNDIPLFETVIRYLGGLLGAYDISGATYRILLDKAVELADILMGSFDTPNRMPITYYLWKPTFASQPHRAKTRVVLAELGSLSLEFTRLAQITKEPKYYDAVARIANELELWQNHTKLPGLWPLKVDASGCKKTSVAASTSRYLSQSESKVNKPMSIPEKAAANRAAALDPESKPTLKETFEDSEQGEAVENEVEGRGKVSKVNASAAVPSTADIGANAHTSDKDRSALRPQGSIRKRDVTVKPEAGPGFTVNDEPEQPECEPQGLASPPSSGIEEFTLGGQADSVYEYLPKEYVLLGGLEPKYQSMYEMAADVSKERLIYRPMIPDEERSILQAGVLKTSGKEKPEDEPNFRAEGTHLTCFVGGMFAVGAKIFERNEDMDIARKLTDGCIWAYEATNTGIMPENYMSIACKNSENCPWNETLWKEKLDPYGAQREKQRLKLQTQQVLANEDKLEKWSPNEASDAAMKADSQKAAYRASLAKGGPTALSSASEVSAEEAMDTDAAATADRAALATSKNTLGKPITGISAGHEAKADFRGGGLEVDDEKILEANVGKASDRAALDNSKSTSGKETSGSPTTPKGTNFESSIHGSASAEEEPLPKHWQLNSGEMDKSNEAVVHPKETLRKRQLGEVDKVPSGTNERSAYSEPSAAKVSTKASIDETDSSRDLTRKGSQLKGASAEKASPEDASDEESPLKVAESEESKLVKHTAQSPFTKMGSAKVNETSSQASKYGTPATKLNGTQLASQYSAPKIPSSDEFVAARIKDERLPIGMTKVTGGRYLLRSETLCPCAGMYTKLVLDRKLLSRFSSCTVSLERITGVKRAGRCSKPSRSTPSLHMAHQLYQMLPARNPSLLMKWNPSGLPKR